MGLEVPELLPAWNSILEGNLVLFDAESAAEAFASLSQSGSCSLHDPV